MQRRVCLIVNPSAGGGRAAKELPAYEDAMRELGIDFHTEATTSLEHADELARSAAHNDEVAATLGGDGLAGRVAAALMEDDGVLAVLPGGRGNDLVRVIGIPRDPVGASRLIVEGRERRLDLAEVDGKPYIGIASTGFDADANRIANDSRVVKGQLVYAYAAIRALMAWRPATFELEHDGKRETYTGYTVAAANSKAYGGGMYMAPNAKLDDGLLDVIIVQEVPRWRFLTRFPSVFKGEHLENPEVVSFQTRELRISADRDFAVYADGDPIGDLPVVVRALPRAVRMIVPS